jgi:hypothetical protein
MRTLRAAAFGVTLALGAATPAAAAPRPTLATVLERAGGYVADFQRQLSNIVAEERYGQDWRRVLDRRRGTNSLDHRELLSDLLLVKPDGFRVWMEFRDVYEVDGSPVREHDQRLVKMFLEPSSSTGEQIRKILAESARFNIGDIQRNVNTPIFPLLFLERANHYRFKFKQTTDRKPATTGAGTTSADGAFRVSTEIWVIAYEEKASHTMIRTNGEKDLPSKGRFWIDPDTGRVLMSELTVDNRDIRAIIDVSYQSEPLLGLLVPIEMRERYHSKRSGSVVQGRATYGRFRQFQVKVDEKLGPIVRPR